MMQIIPPVSFIISLWIIDIFLKIGEVFVFWAILMIDR